jgi:hypothetical protein
MAGDGEPTFFNGVFRMTAFIKEHFGESIKDPQNVFGLSSGAPRFVASNLRDLTNEVCDIKRISASLGPFDEFLGEVAGRVINKLLSEGMSGWHSLDMEKKREIIQSTWRENRAQFCKSNVAAIRKFEGSGGKVDRASTKVYEAGACIVDRALFDYRADKILKHSAEQALSPLNSPSNSKSTLSIGRKSKETGARKLTGSSPGSARKEGEKKGLAKRNALSAPVEGEAMFALLDAIEMMSLVEARITAAIKVPGKGDLDHALRLLGQARANAAAAVEGSSPLQLDLLRGEALLSGALLGTSRLSKLYGISEGNFLCSQIPGDGH